MVTIEARRPMGSQIPGEQGLHVCIPVPDERRQGRTGGGLLCQRFGTRRAARSEEIGLEGELLHKERRRRPGLARD